MGRFRNKLKEHLQNKGMTQKELAKELGISERTLSEFANDLRGTINKQLLSKVMDYFGFTRIDEIYEYIPDRDDKD